MDSNTTMKMTSSCHCRFENERLSTGQSGKKGGEEGRERERRRGKRKEGIENSREKKTL